MSPNGQQFVVITRDDSANASGTPTDAIFVQHWFEELNQRVPVN